MIRVLLACVFLVGWGGRAFAQADVREVSVRLDCREGVGLIPSIWLGLAENRGEIPGELDPRTVVLDPDMVQEAWASKLNGGSYVWGALDVALDALAARGVEVVFPLPVPEGNALEELWPELVFDTVDHTAKRVSRFEISAQRLPGINEPYLQYYEAAVWAIYRAAPEVQIGGAGADWEPNGISMLLKRCHDLSLPLHFLSWHVPEARKEDLGASVDAVRALQSGYEMPPGLLVSGWYARPDSGVSTAAATLSALLPVLDSGTEAVCLNASGDGGGLLALQGLEQLGRVRVVLTVDPQESGVAGIGSLDGEDVIALFWRESGGEPISVRASFTGLAWGRRVRVQQFLLAEIGAGADLVEEQVLAVEEPFQVSFQLPSGVLTLMRLQVEN